MGTGVRVGAGAEGDFRKWITRVTEVLSVGLSAEEAVLSPSGALWGWDESRVPRLVPFPAAHQSYPIDAPATPPPSTPPHHCPCASVFLTTPFTPFAIQIAAMPFCVFLDAKLALTATPHPPHLRRQSHSWYQGSTMWTCPDCRGAHPWTAQLRAKTCLPDIPTPGPALYPIKVAFGVLHTWPQCTTQAHLLAHLPRPAPPAPSPCLKPTP